jgi:hypothetical protein
MTYGPRNGKASAVLCLALLAGFAVATAAEESDDVGPVVLDVVRMLEAEVDSAVILRWLDQVDTPPDTISADEMILLKRAGAPQEVVERLLEMSERPPAPETTAPRPRPAPAASPPAASEDVLEDCCEVDLSVLFRPYYPIDDLDEDEGWDLYVYLDGSFLARAIRGRTATESVARIPPGEHTIRLLWEIHSRRGRGESASWEHDARVAPEKIRLDLPSGEGWKLEISWNEGRFGGNKGPLSWSLTADGRPSVGESDLGNARDDWPVLCEEIEVNVPDGETMPGWARRAMKDCVTWASLWEGLDAFPGRDQARDEAIGAAKQ